MLSIFKMMICATDVKPHWSDCATIVAYHTTNTSCCTCWCENGIDLQIRSALASSSQTQSLNRKTRLLDMLPVLVSKVYQVLFCVSAS